MRFDKIIAIAICFWALGWGLGAENNGLKIAFVDFEQAVGSTTEGKFLREELERKKRDAELEMQPMMDRYQELAAEFQQKRLVLSPDKLRELQLDMTDLQSRLELKNTDFQNRQRVDIERLMGPMQKKFAKAVTDVGRDEGFSMILLRNMPGVIYSREALDITDRIIEKINKEDS